MSRLFSIVMAAALLCPVLGGSATFAEETAPKQAVQLTEQQQKEMEKLHKKMIAQHKKIVAKYVEFGVFTKEKGDKINQYIDKKYEKLEKNGFVPTWDHMRHKKEQEDNREQEKEQEQE